MGPNDAVDPFDKSFVKENSHVGFPFGAISDVKEERRRRHCLERIETTVETGTQAQVVIVIVSDGKLCGCYD